jgi:hypothetical protein
LSAVAEDDRAGEILRRALEYPYMTPERSYLFRDGRVEELPAAGPTTAGRLPLLAYGANASPEALARKLAPLSAAELPVLRAELSGFDVVYSAHVSPYGAVPATLHASPGTTAPVFVTYPDREQRRLLAATEPNYELRRLERIECDVDRVGSVSALDAFLSRHGPLQLDGSELGLAAVRSARRALPALDEPAVLERLRAALAPELDLERFVRDCVVRGGLRIGCAI